MQDIRDEQQIQITKLAMFLESFLEEVPKGKTACEAAVQVIQDQFVTIERQAARISRLEQMVLEMDERIKGGRIKELLTKVDAHISGRRKETNGS